MRRRYKTYIKYGENFDQRCLFNVQTEMILVAIIKEYYLPQLTWLDANRNRKKHLIETYI